MALAKFFQHDVDVLLLDEPTKGIDLSTVSIIAMGSVIVAFLIRVTGLTFGLAALGGILAVYFGDF